MQHRYTQLEGAFCTPRRRRRSMRGPGHAVAWDAQDRELLERGARHQTRSFRHGMTDIVARDVSSPDAADAVERSHSIRRLDRKLVQGVSWSGGIKGLTQLVSWASTVIVARLLSPQDVGLVAMATVYLGLTALVSGFGLGNAIIALRDVSDDLLSQLHAVALLVGLAAFAVSCVVAEPLGRFFGAPELAPVVIVLSCTLVLDSLRAVPTALLTRGLRFKYLALLEALKTLVAVSVTVGLAAAGATHWAIVLGNVVGALVVTVLVLVVWRQPFARPRFGALKPTLTFSSQLLLGSLAWYGYSNADFLVAGRVLGRTALGEYTLAWTMSTTPGDKIMSMFGGVMPTMFAAVKHDVHALRRYFFLFSEGMANLVVPMALGLALVAHDFVLLAFGAKWSAAILPLQLLCCYLPIHMLSVLLAPVLQVQGDAKYPMRLGLYTLATLPPAFYLAGTRWGTVGIAAVWLAVYPLILLPVFARVFRTLGIRVTEYFAHLRPILGSAAVMSVVVLTIRALLPRDWPLALLFSIQVASGAAAYVAATLFLQKERLKVLTDFFRAARSG
jgi:O-antigen/teichoic acid export membrane protein